MQKNEQELILLSQNGDDYAFEVLLASYRNLITSISRSYFLVGADIEDLISVATLGFYLSVKSYDASKGVPFASYAKTVIERKVINEIKKNNRKKDIPMDQFTSIGNQGQVEYIDSDDYEDNSYTLIKTNHITPEDIVLEKDGLKQLLKQIKNVLSKFELKVFEDYLIGLSYKELAEKHGKSVKSIDNALNRIKTKLQFLKQS